MIRRSLVTAVAMLAVAIAAGCANSTAPKGSCHITAGEWSCNTE